MKTPPTSSPKASSTNYQCQTTKTACPATVGFMRLSISSLPWMAKLWGNANAASESNPVRWYICRSCLSTLFLPFMDGMLCLIQRLWGRQQVVGVMVVVALMAEAMAAVAHMAVAVTPILPKAAMDNIDTAKIVFCNWVLRSVNEVLINYFF